MTTTKHEAAAGVTLEAARELERAKYVRLQEEVPNYGGTNHGKNAYSVISEMECVREEVNIVDLGCGKNNFVSECRELGMAGVGVDFAYPQADILAPMHETGLEAGVYTVVTAFDSLEHLLPDEVTLVLHEMRRIAAPAALFVASISHTRSRIQVEGQNLHPTIRSRNWWRTLLSEWIDLQDDEPNGYIVGRFKQDD